MTGDPSPFAGKRWLVDAAGIGQGKSGAVEATPAECQAAAAALDLLGCGKVELSYDLRPMPGQRFRLKARLGADVVQPSIVSLEPVPAKIDETAESELAPEGSATANAEEGEVDILNAPVIETFSDGRIDLGRIAFELLSVSLDLYPRKDGEALPDEGIGDTAEVSPFAALAALRKDPA